MIRKLYFTIIFFISALQGVNAQDSLLAILKGESPPSGDKTIATFKATRLINAQTNETTAKRTLDFRIGHRFGNFLDYHDNNKGGVHTFFGLDDPGFDIRLGFDYGLTDCLMIGVSRSKKDENLEGHAKFRVLRQTTDNKVPLSISLFASSVYTPKLDPEGIFINSVDRFSYASQVVIARKFSPTFSLEVIPSYVHRNVITNRFDDNEVYSIGGGGRWKFTRSLSFIADYFYNFRTEAMKDIYYNPLGAGIEIETGGHVFSLMFTNAQYIIEPEFITNTMDTWTKNGWKFCFNISRVFSFKKKNE